ncbi:MAG TPA: adenylate/guanylate cyclase domain-containing protein [Gemmatimonadales bacterium]
MIRLEQIGGPLRFHLEPGRQVTLGRSPQCELIVPDPSVSRRHAELEATAAGLHLRDLASANGTSLNGSKVTDKVAIPEDIVTFGGMAFRVRGTDAAVDEPLPDGVKVRTLTAVPTTAGHRRSEVVLERLLAVVAGLSGEFALDTLLGEVVTLAFDQVDADRAAMLLVTESGGLELAAGRNRLGDAVPVVPRAIADRAMTERAAVVTASAQDDERFRSGSVVLQAVRSAICVPLLAGERVLGVLYTDTMTRAAPFDDEEARALHAFAGLAAVAIARVRFAEEARREREVRTTFERYFAPTVAAAIVQAPDRVALGGARLPVAVLFTDIRGFTGLAERLSPEEIAALLGEYFAVVVDAVFEQEGTLDKFIGDAVMAVWGAPIATPDAAERALRAARSVRTELEIVNARRIGEGRPAIPVGCGLSYGEVFAGNIGSERRLEYTVVGDAVNVASHLCRRAAAGEIVLSGDLAARLPSLDGMEELEPMDLKGRSGTIRVWSAGG